MLEEISEKDMTIIEIFNVLSKDGTYPSKSLNEC